MDINSQDGDLRAARQQAIADGALPDFSTETAKAHEAEWRVARQPADDASSSLILPDVQSVSEARAWVARLESSESAADGDVLLWVDSLWGTFEFENILYELRDFVTAAHCDADGFLYRFVEAFQLFPEFVLPDRDDMNEATHFLRSFRRLVGSTCARRGAAFSDPGWSGYGPDEVRIEAADLLLVPRGRITERGMRRNINTALGYLSRHQDEAGGDEKELQIQSAARLAAAQLWLWVRHETGVLDVGRIVTPALFQSLLDAELEGREGLGAAAEALSATVLSESFTMHAFCETASHSGPAKQ